METGYDGMCKEEKINEEILKQGAHVISKNFSLREDMFSMLFVTSLRPEYKLYCEMLDSGLSQDLVKGQKEIKRGTNSTYCQKMKVVFCCQSDKSKLNAKNTKIQDENDGEYS